MQSKICYVDPIYFIEHSLYIKAYDQNSAYFNIFEEDIIEEYTPFIETETYPDYVATGIFDGHLYYDVIKNSSEYLMIVYTFTDEYVYTMCLIFQKDNIHENYIAKLEITDNETGELKYDELIYFDTFNDLYGILKNKIRQE